MWSVLLFLSTTAAMDGNNRINKQIGWIYQNNVYRCGHSKFYQHILASSLPVHLGSPNSLTNLCALEPLNIFKWNVANYEFESIKWSELFHFSFHIDNNHTKKNPTDRSFGSFRRDSINMKMVWDGNLQHVGCTWFWNIGSATREKITMIIIAISRYVPFILACKRDHNLIKQISPK